MRDWPEKPYLEPKTSLSFRQARLTSHIESVKSAP